MVVVWHLVDHLENYFQSLFIKTSLTWPRDPVTAPQILKIKKKYYPGPHLPLVVVYCLPPTPHKKIYSFNMFYRIGPFKTTFK